MYIKVQAPAWVDVDEAILFKNCQQVKVYEIPATQPDSLDPVRLELTESVEAASGDFFYLMVRGDKHLGPVAKSYTPLVVTNPVYVK